MKKILILIFTLSIIIVGCAKSVTADDLSGKTYTLTNMFEGNDITIMFEMSKFSGKSAVNNFFGTYKIEKDNVFTAGEVGMTMMAGPEDAMKAETEFMDMFNNVNKISLEDKVLTFTTKDNKELVFEETIIDTPVAEVINSLDVTVENLNGKTFKLTNMFDGSEITIVFENDKIAGKSAVNNYMGSYAIEEGNFIINEAMGTTKMAGEPAQMEAENAYLAMLPMVTSASLENGTLILKTNDGKELIYEQM